jgi:hypothetical protein
VGACALGSGRRAHEIMNKHGRGVKQNAHIFGGIARCTLFALPQRYCLSPLRCCGITSRTRPLASAKSGGCTVAHAAPQKRKGRKKTCYGSGPLSARRMFG